MNITIRRILASALLLVPLAESSAADTPVLSFGNANPLMLFAPLAEDLAAGTTLDFRRRMSAMLLGPLAESSAFNSANPDITAHNHGGAGAVLITAIPGNQVLLVSANAQSGSLSGESSSYRILFFSWGGNGVVAAAEKVGIVQVTKVEQTGFSLFPLIEYRTTVVSGEAAAGSTAIMQAVGTGGAKARNIAAAQAEQERSPKRYAQTADEAEAKRLTALGRELQRVGDKLAKFAVELEAITDGRKELAKQLETTLDIIKGTTPQPPPRP